MKLTVRPDIVFTRRKVAVFVDGCFWHGCTLHSRMPRVNSDYWVPKLRRNVERDQRNNDALVAAGWRVVRVWEHVTLTDAVKQIVMALNASALEDPPLQIDGNAR